jgi:hypothetical protein
MSKFNGSYWENYEDDEEVSADDLSDIFLDEETIKIANRYEQYRKEYQAPKTQDQSNE